MPPSSSPPGRQLAVPALLRAVFRRWSEPCDAALARPDCAGSPQLYRQLGSASGALTVSPAALALIEADACYNARFGQFAELRREGQCVLAWVRALPGWGPAAPHLFIPY
ncbi:hypothetical protein KY495_19165 [Massilia sp. PAMC28688]|uniref:hypothetical protein n=1 Tax=Massilia sp. PAMC28688 TaxID=2861283 RepID=UPI001C63378B|nr:hypothetical protein [Massilia sp. PAMC28688]QYF92818.1 hypothetical protein KY495_19165 [Massilia sp. PAMC28688]